MSTNKSQFKLTKVNPAYWRATFDNPPINMLGPETMLELRGLVGQFEKDPDLKVVVFDSADPDFFIAHFDISRAADTPREPGPSGLPPWTDLTVRLARAPVISIAAVRGRARGVGNEFALACDLRFASLEKAIFGQPEVGSGLIPGGGGLERLPLLAGRARALEVIAGATARFRTPISKPGWMALPAVWPRSISRRFPVPRNWSTAIRSRTRRTSSKAGRSSCQRSPGQASASAPPSWLPTALVSEVSSS